MTDKEKFRKEVEKLKSQLLRGACSSQIAMETRCKEEAYNEVLAILDSLQEEPVSEELEKMSYHSAMDLINNPKFLPTTTFGELIPMLQKLYKDGAKWQKQQMMKDAISGKVTEIYYPTDSCLEIEATLPESRFEDGDKVLIIKEE